MQSEDNNVLTFIRQNWIAISLGGLAILSVLFIFISIFTRNKNQAQLDNTNSTTQQETNLEPTPTHTVEMKAAINEAKEAAVEYDTQVAKIRADFPWLRRLPYAKERFYIYYDLEQDKFIGKLYPGPGDNVEQMKSMIISDLKTLKEIPADQYPIEWQIQPLP